MKQTIINQLSEFKEEPHSQLGILDQIKRATTKAEVKRLLEIGKTFKSVKTGTMRRWVKAAGIKNQTLKF